jgi:hypothetical protein
MKKIPTLFVRDWDGDRRYVLPEITPGCEWVTRGEGTPRRKLDGTCVMFDGERWWARREVKAGKLPPYGFASLGIDTETGKAIGWEPVEQSSFAEWHAEAVLAKWEYDNSVRPIEPGRGERVTGTYELIGPKINGNPEHVSAHALASHDFADVLDDAPRDFDGLAAWLHAHPYEGVVWHHPDGRMAKIKKRDFPAQAATTAGLSPAEH